MAEVKGGVTDLAGPTESVVGLDTTYVPFGRSRKSIEADTYTSSRVQSV